MTPDDDDIPELMIGMGERLIGRREVEGEVELDLHLTEPAGE